LKNISGKNSNTRLNQTKPGSNSVVVMTGAIGFNRRNSWSFWRAHRHQACRTHIK